MLPAAAQNPDELFDVVTADGQSTGITKRRADVHRDGDWHRAIHVWIYGVNDTGPYLLMNQRGRNKDTWPLALDATVGGHLAAGETVEDAYREVEEEIGVIIEPNALRYIGRRQRESSGLTPGVIDREIQEIFVLRDDRPLEQFRPNPAELEGLVRLSLSSGLKLFTGEAREVQATRLVAADNTTEPMLIAFEMLLLLPDDDYFLRVVLAIERLLGGERCVSV